VSLVDTRCGCLFADDMRQTRTMTVSLTPEIRAFVTDRIASGRFQSASEVVRAAFRLLKEDERRRDAPGALTGREFHQRG
jgi:antitoxin ParD1/3/4